MFIRIPVPRATEKIYVYFFSPFFTFKPETENVKLPIDKIVCAYFTDIVYAGWYVLNYATLYDPVEPKFRSSAVPYKTGKSSLNLISSNAYLET